MAGALFRPAGVMYSHTPRNEEEWGERLINYLNAVNILTEAFGPPLIFGEWEEVVPIAFGKSLGNFTASNLSVPKNRWYHREKISSEEIWLTNDVQMNYLTMSIPNTAIKIA